MPYDFSSGQGLAAILGAGLFIYLIIMLAMIVFAVIIWWKIFSKAGYSGAMGLLMFVPVANLIVLCILAFGEWPILRELNALRQNSARGPMYAYNPPPSPQFPAYPQNPTVPIKSVISAKFAIPTTIEHVVDASYPGCQVPTKGLWKCSAFPQSFSWHLTTRINLFSTAGQSVAPLATR